MKKLLAGCLIGLILMGVAAGVTVYFLWRAAKPLVQSVTDVSDGVKRLGDVADIERGLTTHGPFVPPENGELSAQQVDRFIKVQDDVRKTLGTRADAFAAKYRDLANRQPDGTVSVPSLPQLLSGLADLSNVYLDASRAQVQAMNAAKFSRDEFSWVRLRVYQAAGLDAARYDPKDLERMIAALATGAQVSVPRVDLPDAPAKNRELVKPHAASFTEWLPMAFFGL